ncbi:hypothetical protein C5167_000095 [Papaver somniferum]|uniref:Uncharacterized protein n=1 Tax=Papaver somniferum TaxID=3469 RepID=A0A4Y7KTK2_PAPSO|nr:hypothetical protein C5167_000095 [Papaver somniferum]
MNGAHVNGKVQISSSVVESNGKFQEFWFNSSDVLNCLDECLGKVQTTGAEIFKMVLVIAVYMMLLWVIIILQ